MNIGQGRVEKTSFRWTRFGTLVTQWNVSVPALVSDDINQEWRFFGIRFRERQFGLMVRVQS